MGVFDNCMDAGIDICWWGNIYKKVDIYDVSKDDSMWSLVTDELSLNIDYFSSLMRFRNCLI